ncbi:MAG: hypothetical protein M3134_09200 [Actinomycetota bacterium]|nr:hypothetical protein [Actinomycetota bacterium]
MTRPAELWLSILDSRFRVSSDDVRIVDLMRALWEPFASGDPLPDAHEVSIRARGDGWYLAAAGDPPITAVDAWILAGAARNSMSRRAVAETPSVPLHAAAAERDGTFVLLSGSPEAGKTTLLLDLVGKGWRVVTDDLVPFDPAALTATPFPKPLSVRDPARWREVARSWRVPEWLSPPERVGLVPPGAVARTEVTSFRPSLVVFPRFERGAQPGFRALSAAETVAMCAENLHPQHRGSQAGLATLAKVGAATPGFAIRYGSSAEALALVGKCLAAVQSME